MIRLDWKLTLIKQINQSLDSEPSEFNGTNLTNFRSIKFATGFWQLQNVRRVQFDVFTQKTASKTA